MLYLFSNIIHAAITNHHHSTSKCANFTLILIYTTFVFLFPEVVCPFCFLEEVQLTSISQVSIVKFEAICAVIIAIEFTLLLIYRKFIFLLRKELPTHPRSQEDKNTT
jgi:hypothetical protein